MRVPRAFVVALAGLAASAALVSSDAIGARGDKSDSADGDDLKLVPHTSASRYERRYQNRALRAWKTRVPQVDVVEIPSSADGTKQRAIWYESGSKERKPLLVALHSWSADYEQNLNIPFAEFAIQNDWAFMHPDFRGPNLRPEATASDLAVSDVIDAVAYARKRAEIDTRRIYLVGYSGGAMKALVLAGRHPELWAGVVAFGSIYDIPGWYRENQGKKGRYRAEIAASCGGAPRPGTAAESDCRERSPLAVLDEASGKVPILIAHGLKDETVPPGHALRAYNELAARDDRFSEEERRLIEARGVIPPELRSRGQSEIEPLFARAGLPVRLERHSRKVTLVLYGGGHDMVYNVALRWLGDRRR
jgi:dipeptidyl aminopeptidase/acylaminoacyl peptidase